MRRRWCSVSGLWMTHLEWFQWSALFWMSYWYPFRIIDYHYELISFKFLGTRDWIELFIYQNHPKLALLNPSQCRPLSWHWNQAALFNHPIWHPLLMEIKSTIDKLFSSQLNIASFIRVLDINCVECTGWSEMTWLWKFYIKHVRNNHCEWFSHQSIDCVYMNRVPLCLSTMCWIHTHQLIWQIILPSKTVLISLSIHINTLFIIINQSVRNNGLHALDL